METNLQKPPEHKPETHLPESRKRTRKSRQSAEGTSRFFLGKAGASSGRPELGEEVTDENQALIKAFQHSGLVYVLTAYRVEAEVQEGIPILVKRPLVKQGQ